MFFKRWINQEKINSRVNERLALVDQSLQNSFGNVKEDVENMQQWIHYLNGQHTQFNASLEEMNGKFENLMTKDEIKYFVDEYYRNLNVMNTSILAVKSDLEAQKGVISNIQTSQKSIFDRLEALSSNDIQKEVQNKVDSLRTEFKSSIDQTNHSMQTLQQQIKMHQAIQAQAMQAHVTQLQASNAQIIQSPQPSMEATQPVKTDQSNAVFEKLDQMSQRIDTLQSNVTQIKPRQNLKEKIFKKVTRHSKDYVKSMLISLFKKYQKISGLNLREIVVEEQGIVSKSSFYRLLAEIEEEEGVHVLHEGKEKHYFYTLNSSPEAN